MDKSVQNHFALKAERLRETDPAYFYLYGKKDPKPDLTADGFARIAHDALESVAFEVIHYGMLGNTLAAAVKCTVILSVEGRRIVCEDVGEASTAESKVLERNAPVRFAATRARKRALAHAMGVDQSVIIKIMKGESVTYGEDYGVPLDDEPDVDPRAYQTRVAKPAAATRPASQPVSNPVAPVAPAASPPKPMSGDVAAVKW